MRSEMSLKSTPIGRSIDDREWSPSSWRRRPIAQAPLYPDSELLFEVEKRLATYPPLVFEREIASLKSHLARVERGEAFLLQGGDCAESYENLRLDSIRDAFRIMLQMAVVLTFGAQKPVVKVGRMAGQFGKPRSNETETRKGVTLPVYRGDIINGHEFSADARKPDPLRMERAYFHSAATLNLLRAYAKGGFADLHHINSWNLNFVRNSRFHALYEKIVERIEETFTFMRAAGMDLNDSPLLSTIDYYVSHEALLLHYEEALTRRSEETGEVYAGSAHMLWIGERTRQLDGAHVEFARGISNPIGVKCGPTMKPDDLLRLIEVLNPRNEPGRLTLIPRMGVRSIGTVLPKLIRRVKGEGWRVIWCCDPMHGNTYTTVNGFKTRSFDDVLAETRAFFDIHEAEGTVPGGVHIELTGRNVVECTGGGQRITEEHLNGDDYETLCDPRLNASQALELAFQMAQR